MQFVYLAKIAVLLQL